MLPSGSMRYS